MLWKLYRLISYNRKVIVASRCGKGAVDCTPDLNYRYRIYFMGIALLLNSLALYPIHQAVLSPLSENLLPADQLQWAHLTLILGNCILASTLQKNKAIEFLGQISVLSLLTILLLIPLMAANAWVGIPGEALITCLALITLVVFKEYLRRMDYANILPAHRWIAAANLAGMTGFLLYIFL
jgi:hypothetical protein